MLFNIVRKLVHAIGVTITLVSCSYSCSASAFVCRVLIPVAMQTRSTKRLASSALAAASRNKARVPKAAIEVTSKSTITTSRPVSSKTGPCLLTLDAGLVQGTLVQRPSKRNRSPYVADVWLESEKREALVHVPNLDMGGKCIEGATLLMKPARDKKGELVGSDAVNPKYGTPKCEFIAQLLRVDETSLSDSYKPIWVGAHPSLGEKIAEQLVQKNLLGLPQVRSFSREVRNIAGTDMRADFLIQHLPGRDGEGSARPRIMEVKTVVDTDYMEGSTPDRCKCVFVRPRENYRRGGIFPWGNGNQKGPEGEKVVSSRAIKHVRELTKVANGELTGEGGKRFDATILFVVIRHDAEYFRPNWEACPSFCRYLMEARDAGVEIIAKKVRWGETQEDLGKVYEDDLLEIDWSGIESHAS